MSQFGERYDDTPKEYFSPDEVNKKRPCFKLYTGKNEKDEPTYKQFNAINGILYRIETEEFEYEGEPLTKIKYYLTNKKADGVAILQAGMSTNYNRDFLNRLSNLDTIEDVKLLLWNSYWEEKDKNITRGSVQIQDEKGKYNKVDYKYPSEDIPDIDYVKVGKKTVADKEEIDEFFDKVLENHVIPKLRFTSLDEIKAYYSSYQEKDLKDFDPDDADDGFKPDPAELEEDEVPF